MSRRDSRDSSRHRRDRDSSSSRHSRDSRHRRDSSRERSDRRRESSPPPRRADNELPENFARESRPKEDDNLNVLQKMHSGYKDSPLGDLSIAIQRGQKVKVWTRNYKEVRGICTGHIELFDKHWNLVLIDVNEVFLKPKKGKTPYITDKDDEPEKPQEEAKPSPKAEDPEKKDKKSEKKKKKKKRSKKKTSKACNRFIERLFLRGDNVVMVSVLEGGDEEEGEAPAPVAETSKD